MSKPQKDQILLIDSHALVHRAYHAFPPLTTSKKELVNAVYGFSVMLLGAIKKFGPEYIVCAFDEKGPTLREKKFVGYKAQRPKTDEELVNQLGRVHEVVDALNIPSFSMQGYEADDIIGTLVQQYLEGKYGRNNLEVIIVTGDKDLLQLLAKDVHVALPGRGFSDAKLWKTEDFEAEYGFTPDHFIDFKGLKGDPSDNIPGVKGIGDKSGMELVKEFGTVENILKNMAKVPGKYKKKFEGQEEMAKLSKDLATIVRDVPIKLDLESCRVRSYDRSKAATLFKELEFSSLINKLPDADTPRGMPKRNGGVRATADKEQPEKPRQGALLEKHVKTVDDMEYSVIENEEQLVKMLEEIKNAKEIVIDAESDKLDVLKAKLVGFSISIGKKCWYVVVRTEDMPGKFIDFGKKRYGRSLNELIKRIEDPEIKKTGHNLKFDKHVFLNEGIVMRGLWFDTMIAGYLMNTGNQSLGLKSLAFNKLGIEMSSFEELFTGKPDLYSEKLDVIGKYCCMDSRVAGILREKYGKEMEKIESETELEDGLLPNKKGKWSLFHNMEMPLVDVLLGMERAGIVVNVKKLKKLDVQFEREIAKVLKKIYEAIGHEFNPGSSSQVAEVLFTELKLPFKRKIKTGFSTDDSVLRKLTNAHPVVPLIREYREITKLHSTYVQGLLKLIDKKTGRVYTSFNQTVTTTGRLSSSNPNLQNIPIKTEIGNEIRRCFEAKKGFALVSLDYSQIELRVMAHISGDPELISVFKKGQDVHKAAASVIFDIPLEKVSKEQRRIGKTVNFAVMYGMTEYGLSDMLGITGNEARAYIEKFFDRYKKIREYFAGVTERMKTRGYVETLFGRRRYFTYREGYHKSQGLIREANNAPLQGTAADIMKLAMLEADKLLSEFGFEARMLLQVHDELVFEVVLQKKAKKLLLAKLYSDKNLQAFIPKMMETMEHVVKLKVPIDVDAEVGYNWADGIEVEKDKTEE